jgi:hypothetical protein
MMDIILKRGPKKTMPVLQEGELGYALDEQSLYIGTTSLSDNKLLSTINKSMLLSIGNNIEIDNTNINDHNAIEYTIKIKKELNMKIMKLLVITNGINIEYTIYETNELGIVSNYITIKPILDNGFIKLIANITTNNWIVSFNKNYI